MSYFTQGDPSYYVYAALCQDGDGPLYVKFGYSGNIYRRLKQVHRGSPIPARYFAIIEVSGKGCALDLEAALHREFSSRRTRGEWFRFDSSSDEDKKEFNSGCAKCFSNYRTVGDQRSWVKVSAKSLENYAKERQANWLMAGNSREIEERREEYEDYRY